MIASTGWTWDYIGEHLDLPRLLELKRYWQENPPLHLMVKAYLGLGEKKQDPKGELAELIQLIPTI